MRARVQSARCARCARCATPAASGLLRVQTPWTDAAAVRGSRCAIVANASRVRLSEPFPFTARHHALVQRTNSASLSFGELRVEIDVGRAVIA